MAWARVHVRARRESYEPSRHGSDSAEGGPVLADLSQERVTQAVFTRDDTQDVRRDEWFGGEERVVKPAWNFGARGEWSGVTWFFHKDANREAGLPRRRFSSKRYDAREDKEVDVLRKLRTGAGVDRDSLALHVSVWFRAPWLSQCRYPSLYIFCKVSLLLRCYA